MSRADALIARICRTEKPPSDAIVTTRKATIATILKRMESLASIAEPLCFESSDSLADQDEAGVARSASRAFSAAGRRNSSWKPREAHGLVAFCFEATG